MDGARFDGLARALARGTSRRTLLRLLGGGAVAGLAALPQPDAAAAFICRQPGVLCAKDAHCCSGTCGDDYRCACQGELTRCRRACVDQSSDPSHCGDCTTACGAEQVCNQSACCTPDCAGRACGADDGCGGVCQAGSCPGTQTCVAGACQSTESTFPVCGTTTCESDAFACCTSGSQCDDGCCPAGSVQFGANRDVCCEYLDVGACTTGRLCFDGCCPWGGHLFGANHDVCCWTGAVDTCVSCDEGCCFAGGPNGPVCCRPDAFGACTSGRYCDGGCCYAAGNTGDDCS